MRSSTFLSASLLSLALPFVAAEGHGGNARRHRDIAHRPRGDVAKRFSDARFTFYDVGL